MPLRIEAKANVDFFAAWLREAAWQAGPKGVWLFLMGTCRKLVLYDRILKRPEIKRLAFETLNCDTKKRVVVMIKGKRNS